MSSRGLPEASFCKFLPANLSGKFALVATICLLFFALACGSTNNGVPVPVTGNFSKSSLSGHYAYVLSGTEAITTNSGTTVDSYRESGVFTADGNGNITAGTDDYTNGAGVITSTTTGTYQIRPDGVGAVTLNLTNGGTTGQLNLSIIMVSNSKVYVTESDNFANFSANATGEADLQDTTALNAVPSGTFAFGAHQSLTNPPSTSIVGSFTASGGTVTGHADVLQNGVLPSSASALNGTFTQTDSSGRGTLTFAAAGVTNSFNYYVVNANTLLLMSTDSNVLGSGRAEAQTGGPFSATSVNGTYSFGTAGDTLASGTGGVNSVGELTLSGGTVTDGMYDSVQDGNVTAAQAVTGTVNSVDGTTGRVSLTLSATGPGNTLQQVWYLVSPSRAFVFTFYPNLPNTTEDGTLDIQQGAPFTTSTLKGQSSFVMGSGFNGTGLLSRVGTFSPDGNGNVNILETTNLFATPSIAGFPYSTWTADIPLSGTYAVNNGRVAASVINLSNNMILYPVSASKSYILQGDSGVQMSGTVELQH